MISTNDFRPGTTIELDGSIWSVVEFQHVKPGKGSAFVRTKLKNLKTGNVQERTFRAGEKVPKATLDKREMQYLYISGNDYVFMDNSTYDQINVSAEQLGDVIKYIKEGSNVNVMLHEGNIIGIEPPNFVELEVIETEPGVRGDTASGGSKPAKVETGAIVQVPFFVNVGDVIRIDTRTNEYLERV